MKRVLLMPAGETLTDSDARFGIADYASKHEPWTFYDLGVRGWLRAAVPSIEDWDGDGVIGPIYRPEHVEPLQRSGVAMVNTTVMPGLPTVALDNLAIGRMGATHLIERGFVHLGFASFVNALYADQRGAGFDAEALAAGLTVHVHGGDHGPGPRWTWDNVVADLAEWIRTLPTPIGVMACNDTRARQVLAGCELAGRTVPDQVAVIGAGDNAPTCLLGVPTITSINIHAHRHGYEAARLLDRLMNGEAPPLEPILIQPLGVVERQSTNTLAFDDPVIGQALRFIRSRPNKALNVEDVVAAIPASRPTLERKFRRYLGHTPYDEIRKAQINHVKRLLAETDWDIKRIAKASAFRDPVRLGIVFKKETGQTPTAYRAEYRS